MMPSLGTGLSLLILLLKRPAIGGQAVIEGVMIRGRDKVAVSLRRRDGTLQTRVDAHQAWRERLSFLKLPVFRGAATLVESLVLGIRYLSFSAEMAQQDEKGNTTTEKNWKDSLLNGLSVIFALVLGFGLFMYTPMFLTNIIKADQNPALFNLSAGLIRFLLFFIYLFAISRMKDIQRVFEYHGAEHKAIFAYEAGKTVTVENAQPYVTYHPRCGTSFILIAGFACILLFALLDFVVVALTGPYASLLQRFGVHLLMVPLVSGVSYEVLKLSDRFAAHPLVGKLILPGLWIQRITTREPDPQQLEVAVSAVNGAL